MSQNTRRGIAGAVVRLVIWSVVLAILIGVFTVAIVFDYDWIDFPVISLSGCGIYGNYDMTGYTEGAQDISEIVQSLDLHWAAGQVNVRLSPDTEVVIVREETRNAGTDSPDSLPLCWKLENGKLTVRYCKSGMMLRSIHGKNLEITFPEAWFAEGGALEQGLEMLNVDSASSPLTIDIPSVKKTNVDLASGKVEMNGSFGSLAIDTASGSVTVTGEADRVSVDTASGAISLTGAFRHIEADSASGRVALNLTAQPDEIEIDTASGGVSIGLPGGISGFKLEADTASGRVTVDDFSTFGTKKHCSYGDGHTDIEVDTASGGVRVFRYDAAQEGGAA